MIYINIFCRMFVISELMKEQKHKLCFIPVTMKQVNTDS